MNSTNQPRARLLADGISPLHERDARLMADRGDAAAAKIVAEWEASKYFRVMTFGEWRAHFR